MNEICPAIMEFPRDENNNPRFCMCELEKCHKGNHRALMFEWEGDEDTTKVGIEIWARGANLIKCRINHSLTKGSEKEDK